MIFLLLFYRVLSEFLSNSVLLEAISSQCPGALPLAAFGAPSALYGTNLSPQCSALRWRALSASSSHAL